MSDDTMLTAICRAICCPGGCEVDRGERRIVETCHAVRTHQEQARAVMAAYSASSEWQGWVRVPREPTQAMLRAGGEYVLDVGGIDPMHVDDRGPPHHITGRETGSAGVYRAMLAAANGEAK